MAAGDTVADAARALGVKPDTLQSLVRRYRRLWGHDLGRARIDYRVNGRAAVESPLAADEEGDHAERIVQAIRRATAMIAGGATREEVTNALGLAPTTIEHWQDLYPATWQTELDRAMEAAVVVVRGQAGTKAMHKDPMKYIRRATAAEAWCRGKSRPLFEGDGRMTLGRFFKTYYVPNRLADGTPSTIRSYEGAIRQWVMLTRDPPLEEIDVEVLAGFRDTLGTLGGKSPLSRMSPNTIRKILRHVQTVLNKAGPADFRNRDAAGLIDRVPWIRPPRMEERIPRIVTPGQFDAVYEAARNMDVPRVDGIDAASWWRALLAVTYNTGLRRGTLFTTKMEHVNWERECLSLPARHMKSRRPQIVHLNPTALEHLQTIRTDRELVFPWPHSWRDYDRGFHRLQDLAGIPAADHFGLHSIRKTLATMLWEESPGAAQFALGHLSAETTRRHYVAGGGIVGRALDRLPQPEAFCRPAAKKRGKKSA